MKTSFLNLFYKVTSARKYQHGFQKAVTHFFPSLSIAVLLTLLTSFSVHSIAQGTWTAIKNTAPHANNSTMILLSDGTVMSHSGSGSSYGTIWDKLTPDINGSYINGTWTSLAPMNNDRLYFSSNLLKDGRLY